jgi:hypothetical protein
VSPTAPLVTLRVIVAAGLAEAEFKAAKLQMMISTIASLAAVFGFNKQQSFLHIAIQYAFI